MSPMSHPAAMSAVSSALQLGLASATVSPTIRTPGLKSLPIITLSVGLLLGVCLVAQALDPTLLARVERNPVTLSPGQYHRLFTALWFQDGGVAGGTLNLIMLAAVGWTAEGELGPGLWLVAYFVGGLAGQVAGACLAPVGAGNSVATLGLAGCVMARRAAGRPQAALGVIGLGVAGLMVALADFHGVAVMVGGAIGFIGPVARLRVGARPGKGARAPDDGRAA